MIRLNRLNKKIAIEIVAVAALLLAIVFTIIQIFGSGRRVFETTLALEATDSEIAGLDAYVIRDEQVIYSQYAGVAEYLVKEGEKLPAGTIVANAFSVKGGITPEELQSYIDDVDRRIHILESALSSGGASYSEASALSAKIDKLYSEIISCINDGSLSEAERLSDEMAALMSKYQGMIGTEGDISEQIMALYSEKSQMIQTYRGSSHTVVTDNSGYFCGETDGFEGILSAGSIATMTYDSFHTAISSPRGEDPLAIGKVIKDYNWYIAVELTPTLSGMFEDTDKKYDVTFTENGDRVLSAAVYKKLSGSDGSSVLLLELNEMPSGFDFCRVQNVKITVAEYSGYRVPNSALCELNGVLGVYTVDSNRAVHFRRVEPVYRGEVYSIVKKNDGSDDMADYLRGGELIITSKGDFRDGEIIG